MKIPKSDRSINMSLVRRMYTESSICTKVKVLIGKELKMHGNKSLGDK